VVLHIGREGALFAAGTIALTMLVGYAAGKLLGLRNGTSMLISAGTAICGGSAIAAVGSAMDAGESDITVAMGVVFLFNAIALYLFPIIGHALHLTDQQFGLWAGVAIHDLSSVVGAASRYGLDALQTATAVKLSRALWIIPLTLGITLVLNRRENTQPATTRQERPKRTLQIPWFIGLFLLASICRSLIPAVAEAAPTLSHVATVGLTLTLFLIGSSLSAPTLRAVGWKAFVQGLGLWVVISSVSLALVLWHG
jgi:uncharacterized integral membrane protein (TIGR00698 family)